MDNFTLVQEAGALELYVRSRLLMSAYDPKFFTHTSRRIEGGVKFQFDNQEDVTGTLHWNNKIVDIFRTVGKIPRTLGIYARKGNIYSYDKFEGEGSEIDNFSGYGTVEICCKLITEYSGKENLQPVTPKEIDKYK